MPGIDRVLHPSLASCPGHEFWKRDFAGASGAFSVVFRADAEPMLEDALSSLEIFAIGASWGGTRSLLAPMSVKNDRSVNPWVENGTILRLSIGLEDPADLWEDLKRLFAALSFKSNTANSVA